MCTCHNNSVACVQDIAPILVIYVLIKWLCRFESHNLFELFKTSLKLYLSLCFQKLFFSSAFRKITINASDSNTFDIKTMFYRNVLLKDKNELENLVKINNSFYIVQYEQN